MESCGKKLRINDDGIKFFFEKKTILEKYFQNTILFCIFKILFLKYFKSIFSKYFYSAILFCILEILLKSILPITGS